jgi:hypothetical protein
LSGIGLSSLPKEIGGLKKLELIQLYNNKFSKTEEEKIKKLMPNYCKISFQAPEEY